MQNYLQHLLADIRFAVEDLRVPWIEKEGYELDEWLPPDEDQRLAPRRSVEEWTRLKQIALPPADRLTESQAEQFVEALKKLLEKLNCHFVVWYSGVPIHRQYASIRRMWQQEHAWMKWHMNFFELCEEDQPIGTCELGEKYCHCAHMEELRAGWTNDDPWTAEDQERLEREWEERKRRCWED
ncbi:MAG: hypothetical protein AAGI23_04990 [Bacteroidota bacterium]